MKRLSLALGALSLWVCSGVHAESDSIGTLRDLYYGDVLFYYFQNDDYGALTRLEAGRSQGRTWAHATDGDLLLAWLLLSLGQTREAIPAFEQALKVERRPETRNQIWLALGRTLHQRGAENEALIALGRIDAPLNGDFDADRQLLIAQILIDIGRFEDAATVLRAWKGSSDWMNFARYNLGVALIRAGRTSDGERQLDEIDRSGLKDEEQKSLQDRANTALGYSRLRAKDWDGARLALRRVRLGGPSANQALLGLGWAELGRGDERAALVPWTELVDRGSGDTAVQEAMLAVPYAIALLGGLNKAAGRYSGAVDRFEQEVQRLSVLAKAVEQPTFVDRLLETLSEGADVRPDLNSDSRADRPADDGRQVAPLLHLPAGSEYVALSELIATDRFQASLRNARDLGFFKHHLADLSKRIETLAAAAPTASDWAAQRERAARLNASCDQVLERQRRVLQEQALAELQSRQHRLRDYQAEARFAEARLFDRSASKPPAPVTVQPP